MLRFALATVALSLAACADDAGAPASPPVAVTPTATDDYAVAEIAPLGDSGVSGRVEFIDTDGAVEVRYNLAGLPGDGPLGFHVHENGSCAADSSGTAGGAAGGHLNPLASPHGGPADAPTARHAGDLGNVVPSGGGQAVGVLRDSVLAFSGPTSFVGKAVIVHRNADDLVSQPAGDAGARIGCGVVVERDRRAGS